MMDHREIEDRDVVERFLQGKLPDDEEARFEEHLLECAECFERVRWDDALRRSMQAAGAEELTRRVVGAGLLARLAGGRRGRWAGWLLSLLLVAAVPSVLWVREKDTVRRLTEPRINTPIFTLGAVRDSVSGAAVNRVTLDSSPEWIVLRLELPVVEHGSYRATLLAAGGTVIWQRHGLVPDPHDALVVSLYSPLLDPGDHVLRLEGVAAQGSAVAAGEFRFHVRFR